MHTVVQPVHQPDQWQDVYQAPPAPTGAGWGSSAYGAMPAPYFCQHGPTSLALFMPLVTGLTAHPAPSSA